MALDVDQLQSGLESYRENIELQREQFQGQFRELQLLFDAMFAAYAGHMAEEFRQHWGSTAEWFEEYLDTSQHLDKFIESRIDQLRKL